MKKLLLSTLTITAILANAQNVNIPDANFKAYLVGESTINTNSDSEIQVSEAASFSGGIFCANLSISDLTGVEAFTSLTTLECNNNSLTNLDVSSNVNLSTLHCGGNWIGSLDVSSNVALTYLNMVNNNISMLDVSNNINLTSLNCGINALSALDVVNCPDLIELYCQTNSIAILDLSMQTSLQYFQCQGNSLTGMDFSNGNNTNVVVFNASNNPNLTCIEVDDATYSTANWTNIDAATSFSTNCAACTVNIPDANFKAYLVAHSAININGDSEIQCSEASSYAGSIVCSGNNINDLTGIEAFTSLTELYCNNNNLSSLDVTQNTALTVLRFNHNSISSIDVNNNTDLIELTCNNNTLGGLDISNNTALTILQCQENFNIPSLNVSNNTLITTLLAAYNSITSLDVSALTSLTQFSCNNNALSTINIANGNNTNVTYFHAHVNPNLTCVDVDDATYSTTNWTNIDSQTSFSENCALAASMDEVDGAEVLMYPNPTSSIVSFATSETISSIEVYNLTGQKVAQFNNKNSIDVSNIPAGIYSISIQTKSGKTILKKLVKE